MTGYEAFIDYVKKWKPTIDAAIMGSFEPWRKDGLLELHEWAKSYFLAGGKRLRPALVLLGAKEAGGHEEDVVKLAAAVEILHNFTLIHDDIMDKSDYRRGKPTLYKVAGIDLAINVGDALFSKAFSLAADYGGAVAKKFADTTTIIVEGQDMDVRWSHKHGWLPSEDEYVEMVRRKTSVLLGSSLELGFMAVTGKENPALNRYGEALGVAFQIIDDILGIFGDPKKMGKDADKDIQEGKRSLPILWAIKKHSEGKKMLQVLDKDTKTPEDIEWVKRVVRESGAVEYCMKRAREWVDKASYPFKDKEVEKYLEGFKMFIIEREF